MSCLRRLRTTHLEEIRTMPLPHQKRGTGTEFLSTAADWKGGGSACTTEEVRLAGGGGEDKGGVRVQSGTAIIRNALFDNNYMHGLRALNATTTITDTIFQNHTAPSSSSQVSSLAAFGNAPVALNTVTFANNALAVLADQTTQITGTNIIFTNNTSTTSPQGLFP